MGGAGTLHSLIRAADFLNPAIHRLFGQQLTSLTQSGMLLIGVTGWLVLSVLLLVLGFWVCRWARTKPELTTLWVESNQAAKVVLLIEDSEIFKPDPFVIKTFLRKEWAAIHMESNRLWFFLTVSKTEAPWIDIYRPCYIGVAIRAAIINAQSARTSTSLSDLCGDSIPSIEKVECYDSVGTGEAFDLKVLKNQPRASFTLHVINLPYREFSLLARRISGSLSGVGGFQLGSGLRDYLAHGPLKVPVADFEGILSQLDSPGVGLCSYSHLTQLPVVDQADYDVNTHRRDSNPYKPRLPLFDIALKLDAIIIIIYGLASSWFGWWILISRRLNWGLHKRLIMWSLLNAVTVVCLSYGVNLLL
jgi:hypothetical protein